MKALTVRQPWAWAIICAGKDVENRTWPTSYRGPLLIHAAGGMTQVEWGEAWAWMEVHAPDVQELALSLRLTADGMERGGIVGRVELVDCVLHSRSRWAQPGLWQWVLERPEVLPFRACRGTLGIWDLEG